MTIVEIMENQECYEELTSQPVVGKKPVLFNTNCKICTGNAAGHTVSFCPGDYGGPLSLVDEFSNILVGIVSWGATPCNASHMPSVYTRVASYVDWINQHMK